jgi:hypothetical protein
MKKGNGKKTQYAAKTNKTKSTKVKIMEGPSQNRQSNRPRMRRKVPEDSRASTSGP